MASDSKRIQEIFLQLVELAPQDRIAALDRECGSDFTLRKRIAALLQAHDQADRSLDQHSESLAATLDSAAPDSGSAATSFFPPEDSNSKDDALPRTAATNHRRELSPETTLGDRYILLERIGEGGMGDVWVAKQTKPIQRKVAIKLIKAGMDSRAVLQRFEQERQALALMDHPNIARVLDGGMTLRGQPYFVMELVNGLPLNKFCDEIKLTLEQRLQLFVPICQAVQHAHQKGIVHRDLKPANILVTLIDGTPVPKVIDFGVAKAISGKLTDESMSTGFGAVVGTLEYMAPEQAGFSSEDIDTRADIYSLGVILYELLTGLRPIDAQRLRKAAITEMIRMIQEEEPQRPSTRISTDASLSSLAAMRRIEPKKLSALLRGDLDWVVMKCLEKKRDRRYETANALARDVQRYLADETVEARPPSRSYRLQKFIRRNQGQVAAAAAIAASLAIGLVAFAWQTRVAQAERDQAILARGKEETQRRDAETARDTAREARARSLAALNESREKTAHITYEHAQSMCENEEADLGLLWMARSLESTPQSATALERAIRTSLNLWAYQLPLASRSSIGVHTMHDAALSPTDSSLFLVDAAGVAKLVNIDTGEVLREFPDKVALFPFPAINSVYSADGRYIAIAHDASTIRIWDAKTGQAVGRPLVHTIDVTGVAFHPKENVVVSSTNTALHFWRIENGEELWEPKQLERPCRGVGISPDGNWMLSWSRSPGNVQVWNFTTRNPSHRLEGIDFEVQHAAFSPNSQWVLVGSRVGTDPDAGIGEARLFDTTTGASVGDRMRWASRPFSGEFFARASFHPNSHLVFTGGTPPRLWHVPSGKPAGAIASLLASSRPSFTPNGKRLLVMHSSGHRHHWIDLPSPLEPEIVVGELAPSEEDWVLATNLDDRGLIIAPDGKTAMVSLSNNVVPQRARFRWFQLATGELLGETSDADTYEVHNGWIPTPAFTADGQTVAVVAANHTCKLMCTKSSREPPPTLTMESRIMSMAFSPDGALLATGDFEGRVQLWSATTGESIGPVMTNLRGALSLAFSPDASKLAVGAGLNHSGKGAFRLWDVAMGQPIGPELLHYGPVRSVVFSPDGRSVATGAFQLALWNAETSDMLWSAPSIGITDRVAFSPDGKRILARHIEDGSARVYDARDGAPITPTLRHRNAIHTAVLSPDGNFVLTSSDDRTTRLWDATLGIPIGPVWNSSLAGRCAFAADGRSILLSDERNRLARWTLPPPMEGTAERIRLAAQSATQHALDSSGTIQSLTPTPSIDPQTRRLRPGEDPWESVRTRLDQLGGPPEALKPRP
ncbi:MAG: serine/threonine-protein kinase [Pirellula sp.]